MGCLSRSTDPRVLALVNAHLSEMRTIFRRSGAGHQRRLRNMPPDLRADYDAFRHADFSAAEALRQVGVSL